MRKLSVDYLVPKMKPQYRITSTERIRFPRPLLSRVLLIGILIYLFIVYLHSDVPDSQKAPLQVPQLDSSFLIPSRVPTSPPLKTSSSVFQFPRTDFTESLNAVGAESKETGRREFWEKVRPGFTCPLEVRIRCGGVPLNNSLEGKWTCGLPHLATVPNCVVYSFGVRDDSSFEADILASTHCEVWAYDPMVNKIGQPLTMKNTRCHFKKEGLYKEDTIRKGVPFKTLKTLMQDNGGHKWIDILKMNIEGDEFPSLQKILEDFPSPSPQEGVEDKGLPFGQLQVAVHDYKMSAKEMVEFVQRLEDRGMRLFNVEMNPKQKTQYRVTEIAFINMKTLDRTLGWSKESIEKLQVVQNNK